MLFSCNLHVHIIPNKEMSIEMRHFAIFLALKLSNENLLREGVICDTCSHLVIIVARTCISGDSQMVTENKRSPNL